MDIYSTKGEREMKPIASSIANKRGSFFKRGLLPLGLAAIFLGSIGCSEAPPEGENGAAWRKANEAKARAGQKVSSLNVIENCTVPNSFALTMDDGPSEGTPIALDALARYGVKATFFVIGIRLNEEKNKQYLRRAYQEGHLIANHTWDHPDDLSALSDQEIIEQMTKTDEAIKKIIGVRPTYMRPPNGALDGRVQSLLNAMGYKVVLWNINTLDFAYWPKNPQLILGTIQQYVENKNVDDSFISLHHDLWPVSMQQLPNILKYLKPKFSLQSVDRCVNDDFPYDYDFRLLEQGVNAHIFTNQAGPSWWIGCLYHRLTDNYVGEEECKDIAQPEQSAKWDIYYDARNPDYKVIKPHGQKNLCLTAIHKQGVGQTVSLEKCTEKGATIFQRWNWQVKSPADEAYAKSGAMGWQCLDANSGKVWVYGCKDIANPDRQNQLWQYDPAAPGHS
jgi:peptidoglycan/xylan/chitin deacetylase (PgdA/CDA1 family)